LDPDAVWGGEWGQSREGVLDEGGHRRRAGVVWVNLGVPMTLLHSSAELCEPIELSFGMVSGVSPCIRVLDGVHVPQKEGAVLGIFRHLRP